MRDIGPFAQSCQIATDDGKSIFYIPVGGVYLLVTLVRNDEGMDHVAVSPVEAERGPTKHELKIIQDLFWKPKEKVSRYKLRNMWVMGAPAAIQEEPRLERRSATGAFSNPLKVPIFSQKDPRWMNDPVLGISKSKMSEQGCMITSFAMVYNYYGGEGFTDPGRLNRKFTANMWRILDGRLRNALVPITPHFAPSGVTLNRTVFGMDAEAVRNEIDAGRPVLVSGRYSDGPHTIVIKGYTDETFITNDAWDGCEHKLTDDTYGDFTKIDGLLFWNGTPK